MRNRALPLAPLSPDDIVPLGKPATWIVQQDDGLDVEISAWKLGEGAITTGQAGKEQRGVVVTIWLTTQGRLLTERRAWTERSASGSEPDSSTESIASQFHTTPADALAWLIKDGKGKLGPASKTAWIQSCRTFGPMAGMEIEREV